VSHLAQVDLDRIRQLDFRVLPREKETEREYELWASPQSPPRNPIVLPLQFDLSLTRSLASILLVEYVLVPAEHHVPRNLGTIGNNPQSVNDPALFSALVTIAVWITRARTRSIDTSRVRAERSCGTEIHTTRTGHIRPPRKAGD
jgi:hypothetical protein